MSHDLILGPYVEPTHEGDHYALLRTVIAHADLEGTVAIEFGVGTGKSTRLIAANMPVFGFDSFDGLPESWRKGFPKGTFRCDPPADIPNAEIITGLFDDTLPKFMAEWAPILNPVGLIHFDADLYSSTRTALEHIAPLIRSGCYLVFDEFHSYPTAEHHEQRAWREFVAETGVEWDVIAHSFEQWAIRVV